jgi:isochorismate hydrolase
MNARPDPQRSCLVIVDFQDRPFRSMPTEHRQTALTHAVALRTAAVRLDIPVHALELDPRAMGRTVPQLSQPRAISHRRFSAWRESSLPETLSLAERPQVVLLGLETHIAVSQTCLDLLAADFQVFVVADATVARRKLDWRLALEHMARAGALVTTTEATTYAWVDDTRTRLYHDLIRTQR